MTNTKHLYTCPSDYETDDISHDQLGPNVTTNPLVSAYFQEYCVQHRPFSEFYKTDDEYKQMSSLKNLP